MSALAKAMLRADLLETMGLETMLSLGSNPTNKKGSQIRSRHPLFPVWQMGFPNRLPNDGLPVI